MSDDTFRTLQLGNLVVRELDRPAAPPPPAPRHITHLALSLRLTAAERKALKQLRKTDADVDDVLDLFDQAKYIDFDHPATLGGLALLQAKGALTAQRVAAITGDPIADAERP
jgi:hypothetical protein